MSLLPSFMEQRDHQPLTVAIVGASGGIGQAILNELIGSGIVDTIYACGRSQLQTSEHDNDTVHITNISLDFADEKSIEQAANKIKAQDKLLDIVLLTTGVLHTDAGLKPEKSLSQLSLENFVESMLVNALGPALVAKYFLSLMNKEQLTFFGALSARVGSISDNSLGGWHSYRASKAALNMLIKNVSIEYKRKLPKMIVAGLHPGTVATDLSAPFQKNVPEHKLFTPLFSATQLLAVIDKLSYDDSGQCFAWDGQVILP
ncbi:MAG: SDR family NAD(P)-dependent oxidoreductase [Cellvibrionaceae bacterium]